MTNNNLKKASRKIREKEEPVRKNIYHTPKKMYVIHSKQKK